MNQGVRKARRALLPQARRILAVVALLLLTTGAASTKRLDNGEAPGSVPYQPAADLQLPPQFSDEPIATGIYEPVALAFTPDGRLLITSQRGRLFVYQNGALLPNAALNISDRVCTDQESGLVGVVADPNFAVNKYIYVYYTYKKLGCWRNDPRHPVNRLSRFVLPDSNQIDLSTELVLIDNIPSVYGIHNSGDLHFGKDGFLYVSVGDGGCSYDNYGRCRGENDAARDPHVLLGKILRITADGGIPPTNPFTGPNSARCNLTGRTTPGKHCQETFATGLRNPFRMAFDPNAAETRFYINEVGQRAWEEINVGQAAADYGWNVREGKCANGSTSDCGPQPAGLTNPIYAYRNSCGAVTGGAFVPNGIWPAEYDGLYLFADYNCSKIFKLVQGANGQYSAVEFVSGMGTQRPVTMIFGPHQGGQALYYVAYTEDKTGEVRRISFTGSANRRPSAAMSASPTFGAAPLTVTFDASASSDPDAGDTLTYLWSFGDGSADQATAAPTTSHVYAASGVYTATLQVRDGGGLLAALPATVRIDVGNSPPEPQIIAPAPADRFSVGQQFVLSGSATDADDGPLPESALRWVVILHHDDHTHPFLTETGNNVPLIAPSPEDLAATETSYLEIQLTATDSAGRTSTITQTLRPRTVGVTILTQPPGVRIAVNDSSVLAPERLTSWVNYELHVVAPERLTTLEGPMWFVAWSNGGAAAHTIVTPPTDASYTARYSGAANAPWPRVYLPVVGR